MGEDGDTVVAAGVLSLRGRLGRLSNKLTSQSKLEAKKRLLKMGKALTLILTLTLTRTSGVPRRRSACSRWARPARSA